MCNPLHSGAQLCHRHHDAQVSYLFRNSCTTSSAIFENRGAGSLILWPAWSNLSGVETAAKSLSVSPVASQSKFSCCNIFLVSDGINGWNSAANSLATPAPLVTNVLHLSGSFSTSSHGLLSCAAIALCHCLVSTTSCAVENIAEANRPFCG